MERRTMPRYKKRIPVYYLIGEEMQHAGLSVDIGPTGLFIVARDRRQAGEVLHLEAQLPGRLVVEMTVRVSRCKEVPEALRAVRQGGFAVEVVNAPEEWFQYLKSLIEDEPPR